MMRMITRQRPVIRRFSSNPHFVKVYTQLHLHTGLLQRGALHLGHRRTPSTPTEKNISPQK
eukprot:5502376-Pleurochrysis_carterae.AAC.1